jgi:flagellar hook assembly protein FlgD
LPERGHASLTIYNVLGQKVITLVNQDLSAGTYRVTWDGVNEQGRQGSSGVYLYKLTAGEFTETRKMVLLK